MRVVISAHGPTLEDRWDERFGRAAYLLVVDPESWSVEALDNRDNQQALQGAGIAAAERASQQGVDSVITGHLGPKAFQALTIAGVTGYAGVGASVREAVQAFKEGKLERLGQGEGHAGMA